MKTTLESDGGQVASLTQSGDTLYALSQGETSQIHLFDIGDPLEPQPSGVVALPEGASRLAVAGDTLFASCDGYNCQNLYAIDVTDPENPALTGSWPLPFGGFKRRELEDAAVGGDNNTIFLVTYDDGSWVLDAAEPGRPQLLGRLPFTGSLRI